jgi:hypothetical protein
MPKKRSGVQKTAIKPKNAATTAVSDMSAKPLPRKTPSANRSASGNRRIRAPKYKTFRLSKRIAHPQPRVIGSIRLFRLSMRVLRGQWKLFLGITLVYFVLSVLLVKGFGSTTDVSGYKSTLSEFFQGGPGKIAQGVMIFGVLLGSVGSASTEVAGAYQTMVLFVVSLALIWALRQVVAGTQKLRVRDAFYKGMYPLIPFILVLAVVGLQLLPSLGAIMIYNIVINGSLAGTGVELALWLILLALLVVWSMYMLTSSLFALYIVTLPDITPVQALRSARGLVRYRRWTVMRKVMFLPFIIVLSGVVIMVPVIIFAAPIAEWFFFALSMFGLTLIHSYMYNLYRELIKQ